MKHRTTHAGKQAPLHGLLDDFEELSTLEPRAEWNQAVIQRLRTSGPTRRKPSTRVVAGVGLSAVFLVNMWAALVLIHRSGEQRTANDVALQSQKYEAIAHEFFIQNREL